PVAFQGSGWSARRLEGWRGGNESPQHAAWNDQGAKVRRDGFPDRAGATFPAGDAASIEILCCRGSIWLKWPSESGRQVNRLASCVGRLAPGKARASTDVAADCGQA